MKCTVFATITSLIKQLYTPELEGRNVSCHIQCKYFGKSFAKYYWCIYKANKNTSFRVSVITVLCQNGFFRLTKLVLHLYSFRLNRPHCCTYNNSYNYYYYYYKVSIFLR